MLGSLTGMDVDVLVLRMLYYTSQDLKFLNCSVQRSTYRRSFARRRPVKQRTRVILIFWNSSVTNAQLQSSMFLALENSEGFHGVIVNRVAILDQELIICLCTAEISLSKSTMI